MVREEVRFHDLQVFKWAKDPGNALSQNNCFFFLIRKPLENAKQAPIPYRFDFDWGCLSSRESAEKLIVEAAGSTKQFIHQKNVHKLAAVISKYLHDYFCLDLVASPNSGFRVLIAALVDRASGRGALVRLLTGGPLIHVRSDIEFARGLTSVEAPIVLVKDVNKGLMLGFGTGTCPICLEDFTWRSDATFLRCHHCFHSRCIARWLWVNTSCPLCRSRVI